MRDPLPSVQDVRKIFFKQQRKKNLIPHHANLTNNYNRDIYRLRQDLLIMGGGRANTADQEALDVLIKLKTKSDDAHFERLREQLVDHIVGQPQKLRLARVKNSGRSIYSINKRRLIPTLHDRYVALVISRAFRVRTMGRDQAVRVLIDTLKIAKGGGIAYRTILKFDVELFFESLGHEELKRKLSSHPGIPRFALAHVESIFAALSRIDPNVETEQKGVPQGVPSSSVLAEVYLEDLDVKLRQDPSVILYLRYVDDIIVICDESNTSRISQLVISELDKIGLKANLSKKQEIIHPSKVETSLEYLGYKFLFEKDTSQLTDIDISEDKKDRYLKSLLNLKNHIGPKTCWADKERVDTFLGLFQYLLLTHATDDDIDTPRIVTGLGYSAKFVLGNPSANLMEVIKESKKIFWRNVGHIVNATQASPTCVCCQQAVHRLSDIKILAKEISFNGVMYSNALSHLDDEPREKARKKLWK